MSKISLTFSSNSSKSSEFTNTETQTASLPKWTPKEISQKLISRELKFNWFELGISSMKDSYNNYSEMLSAVKQSCLVDKILFVVYIVHLLRGPTEEQISIKRDKTLYVSERTASLAPLNAREQLNLFYNGCQSLIHLDDVNDGEKLWWGMTRFGPLLLSGDQWAKRLAYGLIDEYISEGVHTNPSFDPRIWRLGRFDRGTPDETFVTDVRTLNDLNARIVKKTEKRHYLITVPHVSAPYQEDEEETQATIVFQLPSFGMPMSIPRQTPLNNNGKRNAEENPEGSKEEFKKK